MRKASTINATIYANAGKLNAILNFHLSFTRLRFYGYVDFSFDRYYHRIRYYHRTYEDTNLEQKMILP